jgi:hypothetical protein
MKLEDQVVSLELAKQLKEAGYTQDESLFYWEGDYLIPQERYMPQLGTAAPTVAELGEQLPKRKEQGGEAKWFDCHKNDRGTWTVRYMSVQKYVFQAMTDKSEANARAMMWLYLKKEGLR